MKNLWKKNSRSLRLEQLENRELLSATTWENAAQADAVVAAEMSAALAETAIDLSTLVTTNQDVVDANDGLTSLREAIAAAEAGATFTFADGVTNIVLSQENGWDNDLEISKSITIDGGEGVTINANGASNVFQLYGGTEEAPIRLVGLTITGGEANNGGGIYASGAYFIVENSTITGNNATNANGAAGGGVAVDSGFASFVNVEISNNTATGANGRGGDFAGVYINGLGGASASFDSCLIVDNDAEGRYAIGGQSQGGTIKIANTTIAGNDSKGAAFYNGGAEVTIENSIIAENTIQGVASSDADVSVTAWGYGSVAATNTLSSYTGWTNAATATNYVYDATKPLFADAENGNYALASDSQAYDAVEDGVYLGKLESPSLVVTTTEDVVNPTDGVVSLREAISYAVAGDTITFATSLYGKTITLQNGALEINEAITIDGSYGSAGPQITLDANAASRVITVGSADAPVGTATAPVVLKGLTLTNGKADLGGAVAAWGNTKIENSVVTGNEAMEFGGGLYLADADLTNVVLTGNKAVKSGGGVYFLDGVNTMTNCLVVENEGSVGSTSYYGGGIFAATGTLKVVDATIANNVAGGVGAGVNAPGVVSFENTIIVENTATKPGASEVYIDVYGTNQHVSGSHVLSSFFSNWDVEVGDYTVYDVEKPLFTDMENGDYTLVADSQFFGGYRFPAVVSTIVTTEADVISEYDGKTSLREALANAQPGDVIEFADGVSTIKLNGTEIVVDKAVSFKGDVTIDAQGQSRVFNVATGIADGVNFEGLTITGGLADLGSAVYAESFVEFIGVSIVGNNTTSEMGAMGTVVALNGSTFENVLVAENTAYSGKAGLALGGGSTLTNVTITANVVEMGGGAALYVESGDVVVRNSIIAGNTATTSTEISAGAGTVSGYNVLSTYQLWANTDGTNFIYDATKPLFTDAANGDYTLAENSRAVGMGDNTYVTTTTDLNGDARVNAVDNLVDLGAFESPYARYTEAKSTVVTTNLDVVDDRDDLISLREAIAYAASGATITFDVALNGATIVLGGEQLTITKKLTIDGGDGDGVTIDADGKSRVFYIVRDNAGFSATLKNLTITGGYVDGDGAGVYFNTATSPAYSLSLIDCDITGNEATGNGAGVYSIALPVSISNTTFTDNVAGGLGGGFYNGTGSSAKATIENSTFDGNQAQSGAGLYNAGNSLTITDSTFANNRAIATAIASKGTGTKEILGAGAGVYHAANATVSVSGSTFSDNEATNNGAGLYITYNSAAGDHVVLNSTFTGNKAGVDGGAIWTGREVALTQLLVAGNTAGYLGSAVVARENGSTTMTNCTVVNNASLYNEGRAGAAYFGQTSQSFYNSIFVGNKDANGAASDVICGLGFYADGTPFASASAKGYNILSEASTNWSSSSSENIIAYDATQPLFADAANGDYTLVAFAQAINAGNDAKVPTTLTTDLAGAARFVGAVDLGAFEAQGDYALNAPVVSATATGVSTITLVIESVASADGYVYEYSTSADFADATTGTADAAGAITISGLSAYTTYYFRAKALGSAPYVDSAYAETTAATYEAGSIVVTTNLDVVDPTDGLYSLREALAYALDDPTLGSTIIFADALKGSTIALDGTQLEVFAGLTIDGSFGEGAPQITIDAQGQSRAFFLANGTEEAPVTLRGLNLVNGVDASGANAEIDVVGGAAVYVLSVANFENVTFSANAATSSGGAVYGNSANVKFANVLFNGNEAAKNGGAYYGMGGEATFANVTFYGNEAAKGADVYMLTGFATFQNSIVALGSASDVAGSYATFNAYNTLSNGVAWKNAATGSNYVYDAAKPLFVDAANGDFALVLDSQAIDLGDDAFAVGEFDLAGLKRVSGLVADLGAFELQRAETPAISAQATSASEITLTLSNFDAQASGYVYQISTTDGAWSDDAWQTASFSENGEFAVSGLDANTTYYLVFKALGSGNYADSYVSATLSATTMLTTPADLTFKQLKYSAQHGTFLDVKWTDGEDELYYRVECREVGATEWTFVANCDRSVETSQHVTDFTPGKEYEVRIRAENETVVSAWATASLLTMDVPATSVVLVDGGAKTATLSFAAPTNATQMRLEIADSPFTTEGKMSSADLVRAVTLNADTTSLTINNLDSSKTYYCRVRAYNDGTNTSDWGEFELSFSTAPTDVVFVADANDSTRGVVSWTSAATGFVVETSKDGKTWELAGATTGTSLELADLTAEDRYMRVRVQTETVVSEWTYGALLSAPTDLSVTQAKYSAAEGTYLRMKWNDVSGETGYRVEYREAGTEAWTAFELKANAKNQTIADFTPGQSYEFRVRAENAYGASVWSTATLESLAAPTVELGSSDLTSFTLALTAPSAASKLRVEVLDSAFTSEATLSGSALTRVATLDASVQSWTPSKLTPGATYYVRVRAIDGDNVSAWSQVLEITLPTETPNTSNAVSDAFAELFADDAEDDFWFEFEKATGARK